MSTAAETAPLTGLLRALIQAGGPVSVARFMALSAGHPKHGYYMRRRDPFGAAGDFTTAPEISQMFGELVGVAQRVPQPHAGDRAPLGQRLRETAEHLGQDDSRVSAGPHQGASGERGERATQPGVPRQPPDRVEGRPHRGKQVGAGVAVGNGEYVEPVDLIPVLGERGAARCRPAAHRGLVQRFEHHRQSLLTYAGTCSPAPAPAGYREQPTKQAARQSTPVTVSGVEPAKAPSCPYYGRPGSDPGS